MKTTISILSTLLLLLSSTLLAQNEAGIAYDINSKAVFIESFPATQYRHMGTVTCASFSPDGVDKLIEHMMKQATKQLEGVEFDAMIFRQGSGLCKADIVQYYRDPKAKKSRAKRGEENQIPAEYKLSKANARGEVLLFVKNSPTAPNTLLGKIELPVTFKSSNVEEYINEMIEVAKKTYPKFDAIVFIEGTNLMKANVINFK
jgi:nitrogen regulatory protein PII